MDSSQFCEEMNWLFFFSLSLLSLSLGSGEISVGKHLEHTLHAQGAMNSLTD